MNTPSAIYATYGYVWAIEQKALSAATDLYVAGVEPEAATPRLPRVEGSVAVLPLTGIITQRSGGGLMEMLFGGTKTDEFGATFDHLMSSAAVGAIVLDISSPGGTAFGVQELSEKILNARGKKPIIGVVNSIAASAGFWIASAVDKLVMVPSGMVGSIGVFHEHVDVSEAEAKAGIKTTFISAGKFKTEGNPFEPLSEEGREHMQKEVDTFFGRFVKAVAKGRDTTVSDVKKNFGQGRLVLAEEALAAGMVDGIGTLGEVVAGLVGERKKRVSRQRAENQLKVFNEATD